MAVSCQSNIFSWVQGQNNNNYPNVQSEQNWQGRAHGAIGVSGTDTYDFDSHADHPLQRYAKLRSGLQNPVMRFQFTTTRLGALSATAARVILPAYAGHAGTTQVVNVKAKRTDDATGSVKVKCEGQFCHELVKQGFEFVEIDDASPSPPSPSFTPAPVGGGQLRAEGQQPQETAAAAAATLNILV